MSRKLKIESAIFIDIASDKMKFLIGKDEPKFIMGEELILTEYVPGNWVLEGHVQPGHRDMLTGRSVTKKVSYLLKGTVSGLAPGYTVVGIE